MEQLVHFKWSQNLIRCNTHSKEKTEHFVLIILLPFSHREIAIDVNFSGVSFNAQQLLFHF